MTIAEKTLRTAQSGVAHQDCMQLSSFHSLGMLQQITRKTGCSFKTTRNPHAACSRLVTSLHLLLGRAADLHACTHKPR